MSRSGSPEAIDDFRIDEEHPDETTILLTIHGDADLRVAGELGDRLGSAIDEAPVALLVDLSGTTFLDSMALGVLLSGMKRLRETGGHFRVIASGAEVRRIFEITLLDQIFELHDSLEDALAVTDGGLGEARS